MADWGLPVAVALPFVAGLAAVATGRAAGRWTGIAMLAAAVASFAIVATVGLGGTEPAVYAREWMPSLAIELRFRADGFGTFFALLVSGIGALVAVYAVAYLDDLPAARLGRFFGALSAFMGAMLGIALADDLFLLFVFWEITSLTSFLLIGFWYEEEKARKGALTALQVTSLGGLLMMVGFLILGAAAGTYRISALAEARDALAAAPLLPAAVLLVLAGAFTKSAQVPFHFWLPGAMVAPTPVSTYLHAATMVKAGVFLLGRLSPALEVSTLWAPLLIGFGLATFVLGALQSFVANDLKAILARTTLSTLGLVTLVYGLGAAAQDSLQLLSHAAYKGSLFLVAGIVEHATGSRDLRRLGGLRRRLPITFAIAIVGAASMAGVPPFFGFLAKEAFYAAVLESPALDIVPGLAFLVIASAIVANACLFAIALAFVRGIFLGEERPSDEPAHGAHAEPHHGEAAALWMPAAALAMLALAFGLLGAGSVTEAVTQRFSSAPDPSFHVSLLPAHLGPLVATLLTFALGAWLARDRDRWVARVAARPVRSTQSVFDAALASITAGATWYADRWQSGSLRWYFSVVIGFFAAVVILALERFDLSIRDVDSTFTNVTFYGAALAALLAVASVNVVRAPTRLAAALSLTAVGFLVSLVYVVYRSPDILLTQILIETVSTIFVLLVLFFLPAFRADGLSPAATAWNGGVSLLAGGVMFVLLALASSPSFRSTEKVAAEYLSRALPEAGGRNAVNVIIVDFRALDTTGEITVLVVVALCVYGLLRSRRRPA